LLSALFYCEHREWPTEISELEEFVDEQGLPAPDWQALSGAKLSSLESGELLISVQRALGEGSTLGEADDTANINITVIVPDCAQRVDLPT
jgi:hypothetical protein